MLKQGNQSKVMFEEGDAAMQLSLCGENRGSECNSGDGRPDNNGDETTKACRLGGEINQLVAVKLHLALQTSE